MKIDSLTVTDYHPIKRVTFENLGNTVIIAGANGAGKTRLKQAIIETLQGASVVDITLIATRPEEVESFNGKVLEVKKGQSNDQLRNYINSRRYGKGRFVGSVVQIDSLRNIESINYNQRVNWLGGDPDDTEEPVTYYFSSFTSRWQGFIAYIFQKSASRDKKIAEELKKRPTEGEAILEENPDPFEKYQKIFSELLPGKNLKNIDPASPSEFQYTDISGQTLAFRSLSSGEQEVVKVIFDVVRKDIKHSVIIVDEPELHLHPTLTFKLIETLKAIGDHTNQYIFLTHSADLISTYYSTGDVYFIDAVQTGENQAHKLSELNHSHSEVVKLMGQNLGLFAVGKKLIFVEGNNSSVDRLTYHLIAQKILPEAKIIPIGSVANISALHAIEEQIRNNIFGIDLYMIRDRDGLSDEQVAEIEKFGRVKCLPRRHIENYFLDPEILFKVAQKLYLPTVNEDLSVDLIDKEINAIAADSVGYNLLKNTKEYLALNHFFHIPNVKSIEKKSVQNIKEELVSEIVKSLSSLTEGVEPSKFGHWLDLEEVRLRSLLESGNWKNDYQGKLIFSRICSDILKVEQLKVRHAYIDVALQEKPEALDDIIKILEKF